MTWGRIALSELADIQGGIQKQPKRAPRLNRFPFLRVANVTPNGLDLSEVHEVELFGDELGRLRLQAGDLLVVEGNGSATQVGRAALWDGSIPNCVHQNHLIRVRPGRQLLPQYLGYLWNSAAIRDELTSVASSTSGLHTLSVTKLKHVVLPVPPLREQRRIVEILEDHLSRLDATFKDLRKAEARIAGLRSSVLHLRIVGPSRKLGDVRLDADYGTSTKCAYGGDGAPVLRIPNLRAGVINTTDVKFAVDSAVDLSRSMVSEGDVLIVRTNGSKALIGRSAVVGDGVMAAFASYLIRYRVDPGLLLPEWLQLSLESPLIRAEIERLAASSAGQHNLSLTKLDSLRIPCPDLVTQRDVSSKIRDFDRQIQRTRQALEVALIQGTALRQGVLAAAFEGKLTGRRTDDDVIEEMADA